MEFPLKQFNCNECGVLTPVLDIDAALPEGWLYIDRFRQYCPKCKKKHLSEKRDYE